ncbi:MAG: leucine-rich repeat protein, partial [Lachnospiraceae bacterium]|nr:leucine-rich repeat protein [Lachnospiraceae bacterium]
TSLVVPDTITYEGRTYKVTMFDYAGTEVTTVTLGKNIEYINQTAFQFSDKLKSITINSKLLKSGNVEYGAFDKVPDSCVITVPKKKLKGYKKIFKAAGLSSKVKIKGK